VDGKDSPGLGGKQRMPAVWVEKGQLPNALRDKSIGSPECRLYVSKVAGARGAIDVAHESTHGERNSVSGGLCAHVVFYLTEVYVKKYRRRRSVVRQIGVRRGRAG